MNAIREIRKQMNMTQEELADKVGVSRAVIAKYESGLVNPPIQRLKAIAEVFNVSIDYLIISSKEHSDNRMVKKSSISNQCQLVYFYSNGNCELCGNNAPFKDLKGLPYLKIKTLQEDFDNIEDKYSVKNLVALCPNCYEKVEIRKDTKDIEYLIDKACKHDF